MTRAAFVAAFALLVSAAAALPAQAEYWGAGSRPWGTGPRGVVPACDDPSVLARIASRFGWAESKTWHTDLAIDHVERIHEAAYVPADPGFIDRRFCRGRAYLSNGHHREVYYLIEEKQGFASIGWNVEFCVSGHDPWRVHDGWCRTVRP